MTEATKLRVAATGDIHVRETASGALRDLFSEIAQKADVLLLCGDLTNHGLAREAQILVDDMAACRIPILAVLGNHDYQSGEAEDIVRILCGAGVHMLENEPCEIENVGFAGVKGFAGGFGRHMLEPFGEDIIKTFVMETIDQALRLETALATLHTDRKVATLHYAPIASTVVGEPLEIFPFMGSSRLEEPLCRFEVEVAFHGHAHHGSPRGETSTGIPVYNVSFPLMRETQADQPYVIVEV